MQRTLVFSALTVAFAAVLAALVQRGHFEPKLDRVAEPSVLERASTLDIDFVDTVRRTSAVREQPENVRQRDVLVDQARDHMGTGRLREAADAFAQADAAKSLRASQLAQWAQVARKLGDNETEFAAIDRILNPPPGTGSNLSSDPGLIARHQELADQLGRTVDKAAQRARVTLYSLDGRAFTPAEYAQTFGVDEQDALDIARVKQLLGYEKYAEARKLAEEVIARSQPAEAYYHLWYAQVNLKDHDGALDALKNAYARADAPLKAKLDRRFGKIQTDEWPRSVEELNNP